MALIARTTTWSAGDYLTATALNAEFQALYDALNGTDQVNIKTEYNSSDVPTAEFLNSHASGIALKLSGTGTGTKCLQIHDGTSEVGSIDEDGDAVFNSIAVTDTAMVANLNADQVDGIEGANIATLDGNPTFDDSGGLTEVAIEGASEAVLTIEHTASNGKTKIVADNGYTVIQEYDGSSYVDLLQLTGSSDEVYVPAGVTLNVGGTHYLEGNNGALINTLVPSGSTIAWNGDSGSVAMLTLNASTYTLSNMTNAQAGARYRLIIKQGVGGPYTLAFGSNYTFALGGTATPDIAAAGSTNIIDVFAESSSILHVTQLGKNFQ